MTLPPTRSTRRAFATAALFLTATFAAGSLSSPVAAATKTTKAVKAKSAAAKTFPNLKVLDLATAKSIDLATLNVSAKPQLIWFWAPT